MTQHNWLDYPPRRSAPRARRTDPHTSHLAARSVAGTLTDTQEMVYRFLRSFGPAADHVWIPALKRDLVCSASEQSLRSRRGELAKAGWVRVAPGHLEVRTPRGRLAIVWEATGHD